MPAANPPADPAPLSPAPGGCRLLLRVQPKAGRDAIAGLRSGRLLVKVTAPPEDGKANAAVLKLLAKALRIAVSDIELLSGQTSRDKVVQINGLAAAEAAALLGID